MPCERRDESMTSEERAAIVNASVARALIRAMGMQSENQSRKYRGEPVAYSESDFVNVIDLEGIGHNAVMEYLTK